MQKDLITLRCPVCGEEYLPSEIFMPDAVFGKQYDITKNDRGDIMFYLGDDPDYNEEFICNSCNTKLEVTMKMSFDVTPKENDEFEEEYITEVEKVKKIKLKEEDLF